jgi:hypothetical protein
MIFAGREMKALFLIFERKRERNESWVVESAGQILKITENLRISNICISLE